MKINFGMSSRSFSKTCHLLWVSKLLPTIAFAILLFFPDGNFSFLGVIWTFYLVC